MPGRPHHTDKFRSCVQKVMAKGENESSAYAICTTQFQESDMPILEAAETRHLHLLGATGAMRTEMVNGVEFLVVPVIALMDGVIHAVNAETPERVTAATLAKAAASWNGRPLVLGHPVRDGRQCSANDPAIEQSHRFGTIFNSRMSGAKLLMDAYVDPVRAEALGGADFVKRLRNGEQVEVSVGAFVVTDGEAGTHNGKAYKASWRETVGDHLAFLPKGRGACSIEMGCGAHRAAMRVCEDSMELEVPVIEEKKKSGMLLKERILALFDVEPEEPEALKAKMEDCAACKGSGNVGGNPCEACDGEGELKVAAGKRNNATDQTTIQAMHDHSVKLGAECDQQNTRWMEKKEDVVDDTTVQDPALIPEPTPEDVDRILVEKAAAADAEFKAACRCHEGATMTVEEKAEIIKTLVADKHSGFTAGDEKMLEGASDERLESFRVAAEARSKEVTALKAAADKQFTAEEFMNVAPPELKSLISRQQRQETELKAVLVADLKAAQQEYSEAELSVKPVEELQRLARMAKIAEPKFDYSGRGIPRAAQETGENYTPPDPYAAGIKALQSKAVN